jgi:hypothetical protein
LIRPILYRPFDTRFTYYTGRSRGVMGWPVEKVMRNLDGPNVALITSRLTKGESFAHAQVSDKPSEAICMSSKTSNNGYVFPLWLLPDSTHKSRYPNLDPRYLKALADALGVGVTQPFGLPESVTPEDIFHYIYAVLHAPTYRSRYVEYLRSDFPRIPVPPDMAVFRALAALGKQLVALHLLRDPSLDEDAPAFPVSGSGVVEKPRYEALKDGRPGRVWINATQYFDGVEPEVFAFRVGGYQVLEKWLKGRKGRTLGIEDIVHYRRVAVALARTREVMTEVELAAAPLFALLLPDANK